MDYHQPQIAELYDLANLLSLDADFYLSLAGAQPRSILDLGCGTGTLCCALAGRGHHVTGVDPAAAMLAIARSKPHADKIEWVESAAQAYRSPRRFDLTLMTGHAFQILLTDADALAVFETTHRHLNQHGRVVFDTRNPQLDWAREWASRPPRTLPGGQVVETLGITSADTEFIAFRTSYRLANETLITNSTLRFRSREQIEALLARSGLTVREVFGDWNAGPFEPSCSREMIFIAGNKAASR